MSTSVASCPTQTLKRRMSSSVTASRSRPLPQAGFSSSTRSIISLIMPGVTSASVFCATSNSCTILMTLFLLSSDILASCCCPVSGLIRQCGDQLGKVVERLRMQQLLSGPFGREAFVCYQVAVNDLEYRGHLGRRLPGKSGARCFLVFGSVDPYALDWYRFFYDPQHGPNLREQRACLVQYGSHGRVLEIDAVSCAAAELL
ncbi:hypothetical protein OF001_U60021 [Pseudomonas sp. OF001]|nr:hypothetical protein OF001_U60021 [Pseudomonas sp. OF001]